MLHFGLHFGQYCTVCCILGCNIGALCIAGKYCILLPCVECLASVLYGTVCCMLTYSIVLHVVLHVGLTYWSMMHSRGVQNMDMSKFGLAD